MAPRPLAGRSSFVCSCLVAIVFALAGCGGGDSSGTDNLDDGGGVPIDSTLGGFGVDGSLEAGGCKTTTCAKAGANCGPIGDGCGGVIKDCGKCAEGLICGGGGKPSVCGNSLGKDGGSPCTPRTCADAKADCGPVADGCGGLLDCGKCTAPATCGGSGISSTCGASTTTSDGGGGPCVPKTCADLGISCGPAGDGCGGPLDCGTCAAPLTCGGSGTPFVCGDPTKLPDGGSLCTPRTCASAGANCGPVADGCGGLTPSCGTCTPPDICGGGGVPSVCGGGTTGGDAGSCTGLCTKRVTCPTAGVTTTISGTVTAPGHADIATWGAPDPIYNALVYIPNCSVAAFTSGVSCDKCGAPVSGCPLVSTITGPDGKFTLKDVPVGASIPLVIQLGRWRRQITIPTVTACVDNVLTGDQTRLPRNKSEGDIPQMAIATGDVDALECVLRKIGIDDAEFTDSSSAGRVHLYTANGADAGPGTLNESSLWGSVSSLSAYDMVLFSCEGFGAPTNSETTTAQNNVIDYTNVGGRVYATHFSYVWLYDDPPFSGTAGWKINQPNPASPLIANVDTTFARGAAFSKWLDIVGASTAPGSNQIQLLVTRHDFDSVVAPAQRWLYWGSKSTPIHYTFNTPVGAAPDAQCGRVLYSDFHVSNGSGFGGMTYPDECGPGAPMTPQEKVLEFMLFDLASCVTPDAPPPPPPTCTPTTCAALGLSCGPSGDGCGGTIDCGPCTPPATCGGGGTPGVCGTPPTCTPRTCASLGVSCGPAGDGCGGLLSCGPCTPPDTCGGGGVPGVCGHSDATTCKPMTCADQKLSCGPAGDGCGGVLDCGPCPPGETCGGGGTPGVCGGPGCTPRTCASVGANCGPIADGCGALIDCGTCTPPQTCGGGGTPSVCGGGAK